MSNINHCYDTYLSKTRKNYDNCKYRSGDTHLRSASELESMKMNNELMMNKNSTLFKKFTK